MRNLKERILKKIALYFIRKVYKWWDQAYLFELISDWAFHASTQTKKYGHHSGKDTVAKDLLIFAEYAKRLHNDTAFNESHKYVEYELITYKVEEKGYVGIDIDVTYKGEPITAGMKKWCTTKEENLRAMYITNLCNLLTRKYQSWWD